MSNQQRRVKAAVTAWVKRESRREVRSVRHIYPRAYVLARPAPGCLVVVKPWIDSEPQCQTFDRQCGSVTVNNMGGHPYFDVSLKAGDWCSLAYVSLDGNQSIYAIPVVP